MPKFGSHSTQELNTVHPDLATLFYQVIQRWDCHVIQGLRGLDEQKRNVAKGFSKTMKSKHLEQADGFAHAVDVIPWHLAKPHIRWNDRAGMYQFGCFVLGVAHGLAIPVRWGGDWDGDLDFTDQTFMDLVHFELKPK